MKKLYIVLLLLLFAGIHNLAAQEDAAADEMDKMDAGTITLKVTPSAEADGVLNFAGPEEAKGNTITTDGDAEGRIKVEADYNGIVGAVVELEGDFKAAAENKETIGFGDNAYAYAHVLEAFGLMDKSVFDVYLQGGRFEAGFQNAQHAGDDDWLKDVDPLKRDKRINMQLDLKIMDMLTVRTGLSFAAFDDKDYGNDLGFGLLFEKAFGEHKIMASLGYVVDATNNIPSYTGAPGNNVYTLPAPLAPAVVGAVSFSSGKLPKDFDQVGFSLAYQGTFGQMMLMPFVNFRLAGFINKPERAAYENGQVSWNAGIKFAYKDAANTYDLIGLGLDIDGELNRENNNFYGDDETLVDTEIITKTSGAGTTRVDLNDLFRNKGFQGFQIKVWSDALRSVMGENYLSFWVKMRFETWTPDNAFVAGVVNNQDVVRESAFKKFGIGVEQRFLNKTNASVSLFAEFNVENIAPFTLDVTDAAYYRDDSDDATAFAVAPTDLVASLKFGLKASFTGLFMQGVK